MAAPGPSAVLFACNRNLVRSPMAQGLLRLMFGDRIYAESCGLRADHDQHAVGRQGDLRGVEIIAIVVAVVGEEVVQGEGQGAALHQFE